MLFSFPGESQSKTKSQTYLLQCVALELYLELSQSWPSGHLVSPNTVVAQSPSLRMETAAHSGPTYSLVKLTLSEAVQLTCMLQPSYMQHWHDVAYHTEKS